MQYDFDQVVDRSKNLSAKYDERVKKFGTDDVIPLWIADMDFRTAQPVIDALKARAEEGIWGYTARPASYFEAVKNWQKRRNGWDTDTALMSFSPGVVQTLSVMIRLYTPQNGNVLIQTPVYGEFYDMTELAGRHVIENQLVEQGGAWTVDWADFEEKLRRSATRSIPTSSSTASATSPPPPSPLRSPPMWSPAFPPPRPSIWRVFRPAPRCSPMPT